MRKDYEECEDINILAYIIFGAFPCTSFNQSGYNSDGFSFTNLLMCYGLQDKQEHMQVPPLNELNSIVYAIFL